jgi:hypothetical protein
MRSFVRLQRREHLVEPPRKDHLITRLVEITYLRPTELGTADTTSTQVCPSASGTTVPLAYVDRSTMKAILQLTL